ncbi:MAG TPA: PEP-utilizing enzyme [Candidatus Nanoarchaeia archaeon]|nr:PEP-utilizing enzyme [Candidatus Nanoarchaeia archaeon]
MENVEWVPYLTRPFSLFGASIWHEWYNSEEIKNQFGLALPDALYVENPQNIAQSYRHPEQLEHFKREMELLANDRDRLLSLLQRGTKLNAVALDILKKKKPILDLQHAVEFMNELTLYATIVPFFVGDIISKEDGEVFFLAQQLRKESYYPRIYQEVIVPLAQHKLKDHAINNSDAIHFLTYNELRSGEFSQVYERMRHSQQGDQYVYQILNNEEKVVFTTTRKAIENTPSELYGQCAYPGKVRGVARIIYSVDTKLKKGEILVSINSSPNLMPLLGKCAAIVTDEGGITCHAAIISRELKIPCVIGTKIATKVLKDGMMIEVDAQKGIVKIL